jgi:hypothetical protein
MQSMAGLQAMAGQAAAARATVERALALAGDMGENRVAALAREFVAAALTLSGDLEEAERQLRLASGCWNARASRACAPT